MGREIVIDLFDGVEELDAIGPWEVLASWTSKYPGDGWGIHLISDDGKPRRAAKGLLLTPTAAKDQVLADVIIEPGGHGSRRRMTDEHHLGWLREARDRGAIIASVCTGARVLAAAGLLQNRMATTHHTALDDLAEIDPTIDLCPQSRWVEAGAVITAGGVSAGIDMAVHLVQRLAGVERATAVCTGIEYDPRPARRDYV